MQWIKYAEEPKDPNKFTKEFDRFYSFFAGSYRFLMRIFPVWQHWIKNRFTPY